MDSLRFLSPMMAVWKSRRNCKGIFLSKSNISHFQGGQFHKSKASPGRPDPSPRHSAHCLSSLSPAIRHSAARPGPCGHRTDKRHLLFPIIIRTAHYHCSCFFHDCHLGTLFLRVSLFLWRLAGGFFLALSMSFHSQTRSSTSTSPNAGVFEISDPAVHCDRILDHVPASGCLLEPLGHLRHADLR